MQEMGWDEERNKEVSSKQTAKPQQPHSQTKVQGEKRKGVI